MRLTPGERQDMERAAAVIQAMHPAEREATRRSGRTVADTLREELPDIDDVTVGRVLRVVSDYVGQLANSDRMHVLTNTLVVAMLHLTEAERSDRLHQ